MLKVFKRLVWKQTHTNVQILESQSISITENWGERGQERKTASGNHLLSVVFRTRGCSAPFKAQLRWYTATPPSCHPRRGYPLVCGPLVFSAGLPDLPSRSGGAQLRSRPQIGHVRVRPPLSDPHPRRPTEALLVSCINGEVEGKRAKLFLTLKVSMFFIFWGLWSSVNGRSLVKAGFDGSQSGVC